MTSHLLAIETSSPASSVALFDGPASFGDRVHLGARGHVEFLVPAITQLLEDQAIKMRDIEAVAVGIGPGLFTGLRVGVQTAKTFAVTLGVPLVGVSSLHALAASAPFADRAILACMQAHRGEVFAAVFAPAGDGQLTRVTVDDVMSPEEAAQLVRKHGAAVAGNAPTHYDEAFGELATAGVDAPSAIAAGRLGFERLGRGESDDAMALEPRYLRRSEAEIRWGDTGVVAKRPDRITFRQPTDR